MTGRPRGSTKDPNRRRVINPNNRKIDFEGKQYYEWINKGYKLDGERLVKDENFTPQEVTRRPRGRPRTIPLSSHIHVVNPESGRMIKTNT